MQIETTMKYQLTPVRMATTKRQEIASCTKRVEKMEPLSAAAGSENWFIPFGKLMWRFYKNTKIQLSYDPTDPLLDIHPKGNENKTLNRYLHSHVYCNIIHNSQDMETI